MIFLVFFSLGGFVLIVGVFFLSVLCSAVEQVPDNKPDQTASQSNHRPQADGQHLEGRRITLSRAGSHDLDKDGHNQGQQRNAGHRQAHDLERVQRFLFPGVPVVPGVQFFGLVGVFAVHTGDQGWNW